MATARTLNERDTKLVQWLSEAHAKEAELEADLTAHIALTDKQAYKKRLRAHLTETKQHKRLVAARIKQLGGTAAASIPGVPSAVGEAAGKAVAAVKGQVGAARAAISSQPETHLRNAQDELREEHVEIALYTRIETFATEVGDRDTAQLAKQIRRDEERMAKFLEAELKRLVKDVVRSEVPRAQRATPAKRRSRTRRASTTAGRTRATSKSASTNSRARTTRSKSSSRTRSSNGSHATRSPARAAS